MGYCIHTYGTLKEKKARNIINQTYENGGLAMIDITMRSIANVLQNVANIEQKLNQPWALLNIYWFGIILKNDFPNLAKNNWAHTMDLPMNINFIKCIINKYNKDRQIWKINPKLIYKYLNNKNKIQSNVEDNPHLNWQIVWKYFIIQSDINKRVVLYKYIHDILPTGENLTKYGIIPSLPKCGLCKKGNFTVKHLFIQCGYFHLSRKNLLNELK